MKKIASYAVPLAAALVVATVMVLAPLLGAGSTASVAVEMSQVTPTVFNNAGNHVFAELLIRDDTGVVTTPTDGGVLTVVSGTPMTAGETDGSGCITASATTGLFTIAAVCGVGEVKLSACFPNMHAGNIGATQTVRLAKNGSALTAPRITKIEPVDAGAQGNAGCTSVITDAALADTFGAYLVTTGATASAATTRDAVIRIEKILNENN